MPVSLFDALFALLLEEGPGLQASAVQAVLADPQTMAERVVAMRQQLDVEMAAMETDTRQTSALID